MKAITTTLLFLCCLGSYAQDRIPPRKLDNDKKHTHMRTGVVFPKEIGDYIRKEMHYYNGDKSNMSATYNYRNKANRVKVTVYIYPGGEASDMRFRQGYVYAQYGVTYSLGQDIKPSEQYRFYTKDGYKVNGFQSKYKLTVRRTTTLRLYECGEWFFKIRVTENTRDPSLIEEINNQFVEAFNPTQLVKHSGLILDATVNLSPVAYKDSTLLYGTYASALNKIKWVQDNVDSMEQLAGYPSLYLDMHIEGLRGYATSIDSGKMESAPKINTFVKQLKALDSLDLLDEYIMDKYNKVMIVPDGKTFDHKAYRDWARNNKIEVDVLKHVYYFVTYNTKEEIASKEEEQ